MMYAMNTKIYICFWKKVDIRDRKQLLTAYAFVDLPTMQTQQHYETE